ncbi:hypothetical protein CBS101457_005315 [Exobasidium rhododendri]|nr:hypothetical protein CBS101457_005315 [Exobasidium rhododendri]
MHFHHLLFTCLVAALTVPGIALAAPGDPTCREYNYNSGKAMVANRNGVPLQAESDPGSYGLQAYWQDATGTRQFSIENGKNGPKGEMTINLLKDEGQNLLKMDIESSMGAGEVVQSRYYWIDGASYCRSSPVLPGKIARIRVLKVVHQGGVPVV